MFDLQVIPFGLDWSITMRAEAQTLYDRGDTELIIRFEAAERLSFMGNTYLFCTHHPKIYYSHAGPAVQLLDIRFHDLRLDGSIP